MLVDRCITLSVRDEVQRILQQAGGELSPFAVYGEDEMRQMQDGSFTPTSASPFCFLVLSKVEPTRSQLPFIAVDALPIVRAPYELGNRTGRTGSVQLNVLGRTEGEVIDLSSYLLDNLQGRFAVTNQNSVVYRGYAPGAAMSYVEFLTEPMMTSPGEVAETLVLEGTMFHWKIVRFTYQVPL